MRFASYFAGLLACLTASAALAVEAPAAQPRPLTPPPGASVPVAGDQQRFAKNQLGQVIYLREIDDPANPYAGKYGASDRWYFEHYVAAVTPEEEKHFGG
jgi:hypothetical protein